MSQVSLVAFSLMMLPVIAYVQPDDSPAREPVPHSSDAAVNISAMASRSIVGELGSGLDLNVVTTP